MEPTDARVDAQDVRQRVRHVYGQVAEDPHGEFHFERGRGLAERLGYAPEVLDAIPQQAIESFAGVGNPFAHAGLRAGEAVLDLGSGSGMDAFVAARHVGPEGSVVGVDMTREQLAKAERLRDEGGYANVTFREGYIEDVPVADASIDVVISNGVVNLSAQKGTVFEEIARVLRPGGRIAISDIVTESQLTEKIKCDASLWAACIGGAAQQDRYRDAIRAAGLQVEGMHAHPEYAFLSKSARNATLEFGVKSVTVVASKPA